MKYGIKYKKVKYDDLIDILIPVGLVNGEVNDGMFLTDKESFPYITNKNLDNDYVICNARTLDELRKEYDANEYPEGDVIGLFYMDNKDKLLVSSDSKVQSIDLYDYLDRTEKKELIKKIYGESSIILNREVIEELLSMSNIEEIKEYIKTHGDALVEFDKKEEHKEKIANSLQDVNVRMSTGDTSLKGFYEYLKSNIIGHDAELKKIATILYLNNMSNSYYGTESILIPGPTGTGKTATFKCAANYFDVPYKIIDTSSLVPEGIDGTTILDEFSSIIDDCGGDAARAEKAIIIFDEFDKIGIDSLDIKGSLTNEFLKVLEGSKLTITRQMKQTRTYDTTMATKVCLGAFTEAYRREKPPIGFDSVQKEIEEFDTNLLVSRGYFSSELLTRFQHTIPYSNLSEADKKRIILESKLSTYLLKKIRFDSQFGIEIIGDDEFAEGVLEHLKLHQQSVRDVNNIIANAFLDIEYEVLNNPGKYKSLKLSRDTVSKNNYDLY